MDKKALEPVVSQYNDGIIQPFNSIYKCAGYDFLYDLVHEHGGTVLYIPTKKRLFAPCIAKSIMADFNGGNYRQLAKQFDLTERTIRNIIEEERKRK